MLKIEGQTHFVGHLPPLWGLMLGTPISGNSVVLAIAWCAVLILVGYLWARSIYNRDPVK